MIEGFDDCIPNIHIFSMCVEKMWKNFLNKENDEENAPTPVKSTSSALLGGFDGLFLHHI